MSSAKALVDAGDHDHRHDHHHDHHDVAAWVGETPIPASAVDDHLARLRAGPRAALLPTADSAEGRQLRRWATQVVVTRALLELEAAAYDPGPGPDPDPDPGPHAGPGPGSGADTGHGSGRHPGRVSTLVPKIESVVPDRLAAVELGGILARVLSSSPAARTVFAEVTRAVHATSKDVAAYYARNLDEFPDPAGLPRPLTLSVVADEIGRRLTAALRRRRFIDWLDQRRSDLVRLEPGHEHPGDPHQPDATHRH